jgi:hypothetical protein
MARAPLPTGAPDSRRAPGGGQGRRHLGRGVRAALKLLAAVCLLLVAALGILAWRLDRGPLSLGILKPQLEAVLSRAVGGGVSVAIDTAAIELDRAGGALDVVAHDVRVRSRRGRLVAAFPELSLAFSLRGALSGLLAPTRMVLRDPELHLLRGRSGKVRLTFGAPEAATDEASATILNDLVGPPNSGSSWGYLREIAIVGARLVVHDRVLGHTWQAQRVSATLDRAAWGIAGAAGATVEIGRQPTNLHAEFTYVRDAERISAKLAFTELVPGLIADLEPSLAILSAARFPVSGSVATTLALNGGTIHIDGARLDLALGSGTLIRPELPGGAVPVSAGRVVAGFDPAQHRLTLERLTLDLDGPVLNATGTADGIDLERLVDPQAPPPGDAIAGLNLVIRDVPVDRLDRLWPPGLAHNARAWITQNLRDGVAEETRLETRLRLRLDSVVPAQLEALSGTMRFRGLTVQYLKPLPPVRGVSGTATFDRSRFDLSIAGGKLAGVEVTGGKVAMTQLDTNNEQIAIELPVSGPLRDVLTVIDSKPLEYAKEIGLTPARVSGTAEATLGFSFPLKHDLSFDEVRVAIRAKLADVGIRNFALGRDVTGGSFELALDRAGLKMKGGANLAGVRAAVSLDYAFNPKKGAAKAHYTVWAVVDDDGRRRLGLDWFPDFIDGPVAVNLAIVEYPGKRRQATLALGLKNAALDLPQVGYSKNRGAPAEARVGLDFAGDTLTRVRSLVAKGPQLDVQLQALANAAGVQQVELKRFVAGETDIVGSIRRRPEGGWRAEISGLAFDASALVREVGRKSTEQPPLAIDARLDRVILGPKREMRGVTAQLLSDGVHWQSARLDGKLLGGGTLTLRFGEAGGERRFDVETNDFGATLRLLDLTENVIGGRLTVTGTAHDEGARRVFRGHVEGADYRLIRAPVFAKLLSVASLPSFASILAGEGLPFTRLAADFAFADGKLVLSQARTFGGAVGINASGTVDLDAQTLDLSGTLVPAYTINTVLGYIPLLGKLLLGGEGQGLFAVNFHAAGPIDNPAISVNPLSALAPGFLRNLFLFQPGDPTHPAPSVPAPQERGGGQ